VVSTHLKNIRQWEGLSHILWKIKNVPNHQPEYELPIFPAAQPSHRPQDLTSAAMALKARAQHTEGHHGGCGWMHYLKGSSDGPLDSYEWIGFRGNVAGKPWKT